MPYTISIVDGKALSMEEVLDVMEREAVNADLAATARKTIETEIVKHRNLNTDFSDGVVRGLSYALGAFSGVCEKKEAMSEYIKREDALNSFNGMLPSVTRDYLANAIDAIPAADVVEVVHARRIITGCRRDNRELDAYAVGFCSH